MIHKNKRYALLGALVVSAGIFGAVLFSSKETGSQSAVPAITQQEAAQDAWLTKAGTRLEGNVSPADSPKGDAVGETALSGSDNNNNTNNNNTAIRQYLSAQQEGIIGAYAGRQVDNPADNIFTVSIDGAISGGDIAWLSYELSGVSDFAGIPVSINDRPATGGYLVKLSDKVSLQRMRLNPAWLAKGENRIQFSLPENAVYGYKVANLSIEIEKGTGVADASPLVVNTTGTSYNNKAYLSGYVPAKDAGQALYYVDGKQVATINGAFEAIVPVGDSRKVSVKAVLPGGKQYSREIAFTGGTNTDFEFAFGPDIKQASKTFKKGEAGDIRFETALLKVEPSALLAASKDITVSTLRHIDIPALDMGMSNVTAGHTGYRFLPHGEHFAEGAKVTIKYDRTKIPSGFTEDDIRTYYFDLDSKHWVALERDTIDKANQLIVSATTHFTDMINGVIQTPESPETQGFAPTMMNDIKAADPTAKVQVIAPPAANNRGSAGLSYGFEMPPARNGMQPSLGVQYNSDGGSGWLGEGWDLSVPSISVDTRWGVPRWDDNMETETYSFNGTMLVTMDDSGESSVAHRGDKIARKADRQFYPRNEGSFSKIIRKGNSPGSYTWEVTDKSGTKYTYGAVLKGSAKTLNGDKEVIAEWKLTRVEELHGDWLEYIYETVDEPVRGGLFAKAIYLQEVHAGNKSNDPHTVVTLTSTSQKDKKTNSARYGFLTSSNKLLDKVSIAFEGETLRSYTFEYKSGAFNTDVLTKINHIDSKGEVFASHDMDYYDDVDSKNGYKPFKGESETWDLHNDGIDAGFINPVANLGVPGFSDKASALGGSKTTSSTYSGYVGIGPYDPDFLSKSNTGGFSYGHTSATSSGLSELVDINGDGLPDKVYVDGGSVYYRPNITKVAGTEAKYGEPVKVRGISQFSKSSRRTNAYGLKGHAGFGNALVTTGIDYSHTNTEISIYFTDANNDGLIDLVIDGKVYFNHIEPDANGNAVPTFTLSSGDTPSPINGAGVIDTSDTEVDPQEQAEMVRLSPLQDVVRVWEAPFDGTIKIEGDVQLQIPTGDYDTGAYEKADGVRVAIQIGGSEKFSKAIPKGDASVYQATVGNTPVQKGQRVYFRVQSGNTEMANGAFDQVKWNQTVTYTDRVNTTNPDGQGSYVYKSGEAGFISSGTLNYILSDSIRVTGAFVKPVTSDNLILKAVSINGNTQSTLYQREFRWDETYDGQLSFDMVNNLADAGLQLRIEAQTNIAFDKVKWEASLNYGNNGADISIPATVYYAVHATHVLEGVPYALLQDAYVRVRPQFTPKPLVVLPDSKFTMSVKNVTGLLAEREITFTNGIYSPAVIDSIDAKAGNIWVEYYSEDKDFLAKTDSAKVTVTAFKGAFADTRIVKANVFTTREQGLYGTMCRGWGQFVYNAADGRYAAPIDESLLKLPENENEANPLTMPLVMMTPDAMTKAYWTGQNPNTFIDGNIMGSSRLGEQDVVLTNPLENMGDPGNVTGGCIMGSGRNAISMKSKSESIVNMAGASGLIGGTGASGTLSAATGWEKNLNAFIDMNGDGYPDIVTENQIQLTNTLGGTDGEIVKGTYTSYNSNDGISLAAGGSPGYSFSMPTLKGSSGAVKMINQAVKAINGATANVSGNASVNHDYTDYTLIDVNGDGLPDKVLSDKRVQLNFGYGFSEPLDWGLGRIREITSNTFDLGGDASKIFGIDRASSSFSAGFGLSTTFSKTDYNLLDINADGLPDKVRKDGDRVYVSLNTGNGFTPEIVWNGLEDINGSASTAESLNAAFTIGFPVPFPPLPPVLKIAINPGYSTGKSMSRTLSDIRDVDGDGFPEIVSSDEDGKMTVYRSTIARTNKLKSVNNPLGGSFTLDYNRSQATYGHPGGKWVMSSVEVNDGIHDDGANGKTVFEYADGKQERHEREFLGFAKVITKNIDTGASEENKVYRKAVQEYDVNSVYTAGNQLRSAVEDAAGNLFTESVNEYYSYKLTPSADNYTFTADDNICTDRAIAFTPLKYTKAVVYEGQADGMVANESAYEYYLDGHYGDLKGYTYSDGTKGAYNYRTSVEYVHNTAKHIFGLPSRVQVTGSDGALYRKTEAAYDMAYANHLTKVTQTLNQAGEKAVIDIEYDKYGNITKKTLPANYKGQRMYYKYLYDRDYNMYVERVEDAFGYRSEMENYDYRYGIPLLSRDLNGYTLETTIDHMGRVQTITGPNEQVLGLPYTIKFEYHPQVTMESGSGEREIKAPAYAVTKHYDPQNPGDDLETVTFVDGFRRAIQVKKDGVITETTNGTNPVDRKVMIVSGRAKFDPFGRVSEAFYPVSEATGNKTVFNPAFDAVTPTRTEYDVMDRAVKTILPDNSELLMAYAKDNSDRTLVTTVTDAMGGKQSTFSNGSGLTVRTEQYSGPDGTITTRFEFDAINQLLKAIDNGNNETLSAYDMAGRRTQVIHPASGKVSFVYDNTSNLLSKQTANLEAASKSITYDYDYGRLTAITYPDHPENNVKYTYGNKNASYNRVGRLMLQEDGSGAQEFFYGRLGEMTKVRRTLVIPNQAVATYVTQWKYDSWNRLEEMTYPDEEKITYSYNTAGLLESVKGEKAYSYNYVNKLGYDKFEQRTYMKYCNGAETNYTYDPERRRLSNLSVISGKTTRSLVMDNAYTYDKVDNVLNVTNTAPLPSTGMGGQMSHTYNYDGLYRLTSATGSYTGADISANNPKTASYTLEMAYDNLHNIVSKKQHVQQKGIQFDGILKAGYELAYNYNSQKPHQVAGIIDDNYRTEGTDAQELTRKEHKYEYDANGNLVYVNTERPKKDGTQTPKSAERKLIWDEENRLEAIDDNGFVSNYWYDAAGERTVKTSGESQEMHVNSVFSGGDTQTASFTAYVNPYLVVSRGGQYTKHIYIGSQRIVSKLGDLDSYGADPRRIEYAGTGVDGAKVDYAAKYKALQQTIKDRYAKFEVPYYGKDNDDYVNGQGFCCDDTKKLKSFSVGQNDNPELFQYYYHSDHLGSSSLITNLDGETVQHIEYVPFGEVFIEERNNTWNTPYLFNAKELDSETGLYYYGARYYDPRVSIWLSVDAPLINGYYLDGNHHGGVYNAFNLNPYLYCRANPVLYFDPNGNQFKAIREWWYDSGADLAIRAIGCLQMVGGACEAVVGGVGGVVTAETGLGAAAGYAVLINGIDNTLTGAKQMWTGEVEQTLLHQGIAEGSKLLGANEQTAENIATYGEFFGTAGLNIANARNILNASNKLTPTIVPSASPGGTWITTNEAMSAQAAQYQSFVTGKTANQSYFLNGVKFDGFTNNILMDAKSAGFANFVRPNGTFQPWFRGTQELLDQATRQVGAANGIRIQWFFQEQSSFNATQNLFKANNIQGIELIYKPMP